MLGRQQRNFVIFVNSLGIQDASRTRNEPSLTLDPWTGTVAHTSSNEVVITMMEVKWKKSSFTRDGDVDEG